MSRSAAGYSVHDQPAIGRKRGSPETAVPDGQPVLFLAGWTLNSDMWAYQMEPLARQGFHCIAYDRRAH
ncbi:alpha/beta fold hydrolase, partial [Microvirga pakistanensis]|uniref:alpha/beta fold hydrolase n=1 Tax=Microvirga pakistanensis TaxID=1682650 RepID=UPI001FCF04D9